MFRTIWMHSGLFGCLTKLYGKRAQLVQNFVPRCRVGIFCNEHTRSNPWDPKLTLWFISYHLGAFGTIFCLTKLGAKRAELVEKFVHEVALEFFATNAPDPPHWTLNRRFGVFRTIWIRDGLVVFRQSVQNGPN